MEKFKSTYHTTCHTMVSFPEKLPLTVASWALPSRLPLQDLLRFLFRLQFSESDSHLA